MGSPHLSAFCYLKEATCFRVFVRYGALLTVRILFGGLESNKLYLVMAVDDKEKYEPVAWDFIKAAQPDA